MSTGPIYCADTAEGITLRGETMIANFYPVVKRVVKYVCGGKVKMSYVIEFYAPHYVAEAEIDSKNLEKFDYASIDDSLQLSPIVSTAGKEMMYYIKNLAKKAETEEKILLDTLGWHNIGGNHIYCAGNMMIGKTSTEDFVVSERLSKYRLEIDDNISEKDAAAYTMKLIRIAPGISDLIFVSGLLGPLRQILLDAGIRPPCIPYVVGESQCKKTTLVRLCALMYNRSEPQNDSDIGCKRVSSSEFKLEETIAELKDTSFLLDDLFKTENKKMKKLYEGRIENAIRNFADNSPRTTARSSFKNNSQIIVTAEYLIESKTDVGRLFLICVGKNGVDVQKLSECQKSPLALSTFYYHFISWLASGYDEIVERMKEKYTEFRFLAQTYTGKFGRLYEYFFVIEFAFSLYLEYVENAGVSIDKEIVSSVFHNNVGEALKKQYDILTHLDKREVKSINLSRVLVDMISDGSVTLSEKWGDCFKEGGYIRIRIIYFKAKIRDIYKQDLTEKRIAAYFRDRYISKVDSDKRQSKCNGKRYLKLNKAELIKDAYDNRCDIENLFC